MKYTLKESNAAGLQILFKNTQQHAFLNKIGPIDFNI